MKRWIYMLGLVGSLAGSEVLSVAHPDQVFDEKRTVVWTPTFQAGWDAMNADLGGPPKVSGSDLGGKLDGFQWKPEKVMPEGRWKVWSGAATRGFFRKVNAEAADFLGEDDGPFQEVQGARGGSVAFYSLLDAKVVYPEPFYRSRKVPMRFVGVDEGQSKVSFWGVTGEDSGDFRGQVRILSWRKKAGFHAVELRGRHAKHGAVVLYQPPRAQDFSTACRWVRKWRGQWAMLSGGDFGSHSDRSMHSGDILRVPYLELSARGDFKDDLQGGRIYGRPGDPYVVFAARQWVQFKLNERGAEVRAAAEGGMDPFGAAPPTVPRDFSFDRPFFVFLWRDDAHWPYFGAWIGNDSAMTEFGESR